MSKPRLILTSRMSRRTDPALTAYDEQHVVTYIRLLQAESEGLIGGRSHE